MRYSIKHFMHDQVFAGILLILVTFIALIAANSSFGDLYNSVMQSHKAQVIVNDGLMALFFLLMGLEVKRECLIGELASREKILQPIFAALGGMVVPALFYSYITRSQPDLFQGWAIPCATDIAFALGVLALLGKRIPTAINVMLAAIAILDDLGAILIIAFFYTDGLDMTHCLVTLTAVIGLIALRGMKETYLISYLFCGAVLWYGFLKLGLHPTLAGVVTAFFIPLEVKQKKKKTVTPAADLEDALHPWVMLGVIPVFAFANAGLSLSGIEAGDIMRPLSLGIFLGLFIGKPVGIMAGLYIGHITRIARKAVGTTWKDYIGMAVLCGIGFTMALFIGDLAFEDPVLDSQIKIGVLSASLLSAGIGWLICRLTFKHR